MIVTKPVKNSPRIKTFIKDRTCSYFSHVCYITNLSIIPNFTTQIIFVKIIFRLPVVQKYPHEYLMNPLNTPWYWKCLTMMWKWYCCRHSYKWTNRDSGWSDNAKCPVFYIYIYIYIYLTKVVKTAIPFCTNNTNAYTEYTNIKPLFFQGSTALSYPRHPL